MLRVPIAVNVSNALPIGLPSEHLPRAMRRLILATGEDPPVRISTRGSLGKASLLPPRVNRIIEDIHLL